MKIDTIKLAFLGRELKDDNDLLEGITQVVGGIPIYKLNYHEALDAISEMNPLGIHLAVVGMFDIGPAGQVHIVEQVWKTRKKNEPKMPVVTLVSQYSSLPELVKLAENKQTTLINYDKNFISNLERILPVIVKYWSGELGTIK